MSCLAIGLALSLHIGMEHDYNEFHPYVTCEKEKVMAGMYLNSMDKVSVFGAYKLNLSEDLILDVGLVTGYFKEVVPMARLRYKQIFVMPAVEKEGTGLVLGVQFYF